MSPIVMRDALHFEPSVERPLGGALPPRIIAGGMGGSASAAMALPYAGLSRPVFLHEEYDLPEEAPADALYLAVSYSGNTEETLSFAHMALERKLPFAAVASGGTLAALARENGAPLALVPDGIAPRSALPYLLRAELALLGEEDLLKQVADAVPDEELVEHESSALYNALEGKVPLFYASHHSALLARIGKMYWNETAKGPAFASIVPARNHDELQGFDPAGVGAWFSSRFCAVLLRDPTDDPRVAHRFEVLAQYFPELRVSVHPVALPGGPAALRLMYFWHLAEKVARLSSLRHGGHPDDNPVTEEFKRRL